MLRPSVVLDESTNTSNEDAMSERQRQGEGRGRSDDEQTRGDERVQDITVSSYGSSENDQTRTRERAGNHLDEAGEPTLAEAEELRRGERHED